MKAAYCFFKFFLLLYTLAATVEGSPECLCAAFNKPIWNEQPLQWVLKLGSHRSMLENLFYIKEAERNTQLGTWEAPPLAQNLAHCIEHEYNLGKKGWTDFFFQSLFRGFVPMVAAVITVGAAPPPQYSPVSHDYCFCFRSHFLIQRTNALSIYSNNVM